MQTRKFDEMISYFNRKVSSMDIDQKCKMEILGMITAIGLAHEKEMPHWVLCSERLPEDGTEVFVYLFDRPSPFIAWIEDTRWYTEDFEVERENEPIAWQPLPEPYREEGD